jgi:signal transduction histidine kinase
LLPVAEKRVEDDEVKNMIEVSLKQAENMKDLLTETVTLASLNEEVEDSSFEDIHLSDYITHIVEENDEFFQDYAIEIDNQIESEIIVRMDKTYLHELVMNLLTNAVKYTPEEKNGIIQLDAIQKSDECVVSIKDNGIGIEDDELNKIFDKFYRKGKPRDGLESTGLGLSICKNIVKRYDGRIWAESEGPDKGSTFYFTLPNSVRNNI